MPISEEGKKALIQFIKRCRDRANKTQPEFAKAVGVHFRTISKWETGATRISIDNIEAVARAIKLPLDACLRVPIESAKERVELDLLEDFRLLSPLQQASLLKQAHELAELRRLRRERREGGS